MNKNEILEIMKNMQTYEEDGLFRVSYRLEGKIITISYDKDTDKLISVVTLAN